MDRLRVRVYEINSYLHYLYYYKANMMLVINFAGAS